MREIITQTSEDVEYIVVNGEIVNRFITETIVDLGKNAEETVKRIWIANADGVSEDEDVTVNAYDKNGKASESRNVLSEDGSDNSYSDNYTANSQNIGKYGSNDNSKKYFNQ